MPQIPQSTIDKIRDQADIVDVISREVELKRKGVNYFGICPFHDEKTPSFMVSPAKRIFKDFSSGKGGNVVTFLMEHEHFTYPEALKWLANKYQIEIEEKDPKKAENKVDEMCKKLLVNLIIEDYKINKI